MAIDRCLGCFIERSTLRSGIEAAQERALLRFDPRRDGIRIADAGLQTLDQARA